MKKVKNKPKVKVIPKSENIAFNHFFDICLRKRLFVEEHRIAMEQYFQNQGVASTDNIKKFESALKNY